MIITKENELLEWCKAKKVFNYVDVGNYSLEKFYLRAERTIRDFVNKGKLRRIPDEESSLRWLRKTSKVSLAWFEIV